MKDDDLITLWKQGNYELLTNRRFDHAELEALLTSRIGKVSSSLYLSIVFYTLVQIAAMVLIGFDLYGYRSNVRMLAVLISMLIMCSLFLGYGVFLLNHIRSIGYGCLDVVTTIRQKLKIYRTHYEVWMWIMSISLVFLAFALNALIDNNNGTYPINHPVVFAVGNVSMLLLVYGVQKFAQLKALRHITMYIADLQNNALAESRKLEEAKHRYRIVRLVLLIVLILLLLWGIVKCLQGVL